MINLLQDFPVDLDRLGVLSLSSKGRGKTKISRLKGGVDREGLAIDDCRAVPCLLLHHDPAQMEIPDRRAWRRRDPTTHNLFGILVALQSGMDQTQRKIGCTVVGPKRYDFL